MSVTFDLFTRWKAAKGIESDRQALTALGVSHGAAVHWKAGRNGDAAVIEKMASDLGDNALLLVALAMKEQSQGDAAKTWARFARQLGAAAALAIVGLFVALPGQARASITGHSEAEPQHPLCIMRSNGKSSRVASQRV